MSGSKKQQELTDEERAVKAQFEQELRRTEKELQYRLRHRPVPKGDEPQVIITI